MNTGETITLTTVGDAGVSIAGETSAFLLKLFTENILVDTGTNVAFSIESLGTRLVDIEYVFISHVHADHMQGLVNYVFNRSVQARSLENVKPLKVLTSESTAKSAKQALSVHYPERTFQIEWIDKIEGEYGNQKFSVKPFPVSHTVDCMGLRVEINGKLVLAYTADTEMIPQLLENMRDAKVAIVECFGFQSHFETQLKANKHLSVEDAIELLREARITTAVPFHMHTRYIKSPEDRNNFRTSLEELAPEITWRAEGPGQVTEIGTSV